MAKDPFSALLEVIKQQEKFSMDLMGKGSGDKRLADLPKVEGSGLSVKSKKYAAHARFLDTFALAFYKTYGKHAASGHVHTACKDAFRAFSARSITEYMKKVYKDHGLTECNADVSAVTPGHSTSTADELTKAARKRGLDDLETKGK